MADKLTFEELLARANAQPARKKPNHPEDDLQMACCQWYDLQWGGRRINGEKIGRLLHHSPNGGKRSAREAARFKAMGDTILCDAEFNNLYRKHGQQKIKK